MTFKCDQEMEMEIYPLLNKLSDKDANRLKKIHANIHLSVNENGQIFLINRSSNKLYFFYQDFKNDYKVQKITATYLKLIGADTSNNTLLLWGK